MRQKKQKKAKQKKGSNSFLKQVHDGEYKILKPRTISEINNEIKKFDEALKEKGLSVYDSHRLNSIRRDLVWQRRRKKPEFVDVEKKMIRFGSINMDFIINGLRQCKIKKQNVEKISKKLKKIDQEAKEKIKNINKQNIPSLEKQMLKLKVEGKTVGEIRDTCKKIGVNVNETVPHYIQREKDMLKAYFKAREVREEAMKKLTPEERAKLPEREVIAETDTIILEGPVNKGEDESTKKKKKYAA